MALDDLIAAYGEQYDQLRILTGDAVEQLWLELGGPDDRRAVEAAEAMLELVNTAAAETAELVDGYVADYVSTVTRRPPRSVSPLDLADYVVDQLRNGTPGRTVYQRPAVELRRLLSEGRPYDEALAQAGRRAAGMAEADVALAHRRAAADRMSSTPGVDGYQRVLTGASCLLCAVASTQRYKTSELMPIHTRCDCRVAPIVDGDNYGRIVNRELYAELKSSGALDKLNRSNAGRSGQARARAASVNRARQQQLANVGRGVQDELNLPRPPSAGTLADDLSAGATRRTAPVSAAVAQHGELGPVLVSDRHTFTQGRPSRSGAHRLDELPPARPPAGPVDVDLPPRPPAAPPARYSVDSPEVLRAAARRNVAPQKVADELNRKHARRLADAADARAYRRSLSVDHPDVIEAAAKADVSPEEVMVALEEVGEARRSIAELAAQVQAEAYGDLYAWDALKIAAPPPATARNAFGRKLRGGEYDWLEQLDDREKARLSRRWYDQHPARTYTPDQIAENISNARGIDVDVDEAVEIFLDRTRRYEAAGAVRRGRLPSARAYSDAIDVDQLISHPLYLPSRIVGVDDLQAAAHIARRQRELISEEAFEYLEAAANPRHGPSPYRMSYQTWEDEVRQLEYALGTDERVIDIQLGDELVSFSRRDAEERLRELVPRFLDEPGASFEEVYARIIHTARQAGEEVPSYARIPWS
jgi:hypothetical protein